MFLERVHSAGIAHVSYLIGDGDRAAVIDPRRDCRIYAELARQHGARIFHIFETHRNEDYVIGSLDLARMTGAEIHHGAGLPFEYGHTVSEGDAYDVGSLRLAVLSTPGHTMESISITAADLTEGDGPFAVFSGDALFVGDVGRTDFFPGRSEEVAGMLYDSLFGKLLPLGDDVLVYPAHGAGSICGGRISAREFSTIGHERKHNRALQMTDRAEFIAFKVGENHYSPPYFRKMEEYNLKGAPTMQSLPEPCACSADEFAAQIEEGMIVVDARSPEGFGGAHIPGSLSVPLEMVPLFAGWLLPYDKPIGLVVEHTHDVETAVRYLVRLGYDGIAAYLGEGMHDWETGGRHFEGIPQVYIGEIKRRMDAGEEFTLLDVRSEQEFAAGHLRGAVNVYLGQLPDRLGDIPAARPITCFCGSGHRAIIAASILKRNGLDRVENCLGSMAACRATACPMATGA
jgi:hydroxyacylglutathione hydrolase